MSKSEELQRMERDLNEQPELREKLDAEIKRIAEAGEAQSDGEAIVKAAASLGYDVTLEELERAAADLEKLDDGELEASGGSGNRPADGEYCFRDFSCDSMWNTATEDEKGHNAWCHVSWHCYVAILHTETNSKNVHCWSDYICELIQKDDTYKPPKKKRK